MSEMDLPALRKVIAEEWGPEFTALQRWSIE